MILVVHLYQSLLNCLKLDNCVEGLPKMPWTKCLQYLSIPPNHLFFLISIFGPQEFYRFCVCHICKISQIQSSFILRFIFIFFFETKLVISLSYLWLIFLKDLTPLHFSTQSNYINICLHFFQLISLYLQLTLFWLRTW